MGIDYEHCSYCEEIQPDCDLEYLYIENLGDLELGEQLNYCESCIHELKRNGMLNVVKPGVLYISEHKITKERILHRDWDSIKRVKPVSNYNFGLWGFVNPSKYLIEAVIDKKKLTLEKVETTIKNLKKKCNGKDLHPHITVFFTWKNHKPSSNPTIGKPYPIALQFRTNEHPDIFMTKLREYIQEYSLEDNEMNIHWLYHKGSMNRVEFFEWYNELKIIWFNSRKKLNRERVNLEYQTRETVWIATKKYFEVKCNQIKYEIELVKKKYDEIMENYENAPEPN